MDRRYYFFLPSKYHWTSEQYPYNYQQAYDYRRTADLPLTMDILPAGPKCWALFLLRRADNFEGFWAGIIVLDLVWAREQFLKEQLFLALWRGNNFSTRGTISGRHDYRNTKIFGIFWRRRRKFCWFSRLILKISIEDVIQTSYRYHIPHWLMILFLYTNILRRCSC